MIVHRRCQDKVGHFCGLEQRYLESYEQWKLNVGFAFFFMKERKCFVFV